MEEEMITNDIRSLQEVENIETDEDAKKRYNNCVEDIRKEKESIEESENDLRNLEKKEQQLKVQLSYMYNIIVDKVYLYNNIHMKDYIKNERHNVLNEDNDDDEIYNKYNRETREQKLEVLNRREIIIDIMESVKQWRNGPIRDDDKIEIDFNYTILYRSYKAKKNGVWRPVYRHN